MRLVMPTDTDVAVDADIRDAVTIVHLQKNDVDVQV